MRIPGIVFCSFLFCALILLTIHYYIILHLYFLPRLEAVSFERNHHYHHERTDMIYSNNGTSVNRHRFNDKQLLLPSSIMDSSGIKHDKQKSLGLKDPSTRLSSSPSTRLSSSPSILLSSSPSILLPSSPSVLSKDQSPSTVNGQHLLLNNSNPLETTSSSIQVTRNRKVTKERTAEEQTHDSSGFVNKSPFFALHQSHSKVSKPTDNDLNVSKTSTVSNVSSLKASNQMIIQDVKKLKEKVMKDLKKWEFESTNILFHPQSRSNRYNVKHVRKSSNLDPNPDNFCNGIKLGTIDGSFPGIISKGVYGSLTGQSLNDAIRDRIMDKLEPNNSSQNKRLLSSSLNCALVTNSAALIGSKNGQDIDSNDLVLRFNDAPMGGQRLQKSPYNQKNERDSNKKNGRDSSQDNERDSYQSSDPFLEDVGSVSDIRMINSKVFSDPNFNISSPVFKDQILIVWDPYQYMTFDASFDMDLIAGNLEGVHPRMDHDFYNSFIRIREENPEVKMYILDPRTVWDSWKLIQETSFHRIPKTPPSSGFLGLVLLSKFCSTITMYEYIPSIRVTNTCHYYDVLHDGGKSSAGKSEAKVSKNTGGVGPGCTFGDWHPLSSEKLFALRLNYASDSDVFVGGRTKLAGCSNGWPQNLIKSFNMWKSN